MSSDSSANNYLSIATNYKKEIENTLQEIKNKYSLLVIDYIKNVKENTKIDNSIFLRGFKTITHVFTLLLFYTRNLDVSYYHAQKSFYFYIEFIQQITDDKNTFLNLNSKDATTFVYKKTIFEINNEIKKSIQPLNIVCQKKIDYLNVYVNFIQQIIEFLNCDKDLIIDCIKNLNKYISTLSYEQLLLTHSFQLSLKMQLVDCHVKKYIELLEIFMKKQKKQKKIDFSIKKMQLKTISDEFKRMLESESSQKIFQWLNL
jgi:hypothetical protein